MFKYISHIPKKCLRKILLTFLLDKCFELAKHSITQNYVVWTLFLVLFLLLLLRHPIQDQEIDFHTGSNI